MTSTLNRSTWTARVPEINVDPVNTVYSQTFAVNADSWTAFSGSGASISRQAVAGQDGTTGVLSATIFSAATVNQAQRTITGLTAGKTYTFTGWAKASNPRSAAFRSSVNSAYTLTSLPPGIWTPLTHTFVATSTSATIYYVGNYPGSTDSLHLDSFRLIAHSDYLLDVMEAEVTLDEARAPYVEARLTVALPPEVIAEQIDPRDRIRILIDATNSVVGQPTQTRSFDLLLHERTANQQGELVLTVVSDEALLIDLAHVATTEEHRPGLDVPTFVSWALAKVGASLTTSTPGTLADDKPLVSVITNLLPNPNFRTSIGNWIAGGANGTLTRQTGLVDSPVPGVTTYSRTTWTAASGVDGGGAYTRSDANAPFATIDPTKRYTVAAWVRCNKPTQVRLNAQYYNASGALQGTQLGTAFDLAPNVWVQIKHTFTPGNNFATATRMGPFVYRSGGQQFWPGDLFDTLGWTITEGNEAPGTFDGATSDTPFRDHAWTGAANASNSTLTFLPMSNAARIRPGQTLWDWLSPILTASGLRLFCDESRQWHLVPAVHSVSGVLVISSGYNAIEADDQVSLQGDYCDSVVVRYSWTDELGASFEKYDVAGSGGRTRVIDYDQAYPGPGAAAGILARAQGRGRSQTLKALLNLTATPGMALASTLPGWPSQSGSVAAVTFKWAAEGDSDTMTVRSRGLIDTDPSAWVLATGEWDDRPPTTTWTTYPA